ncbi:MAG: type II secretion system protein GspL [Pseudomonadota bacterium]
MTTLYIRHPARAEGTGAPCQFALVADGGSLVQQGAGALSGLGDLIMGARRVVLLLAASDVTLLHVKAPPLSAARLKAALPGLVEEAILADPADCVLVAAPTDSPDGLRSVAVVQRAWLDVLVKAVRSLGARGVAAIPGQLCLPLQPGSVSAHVGLHELTIRRAQYDGMGLATAADAATVRAFAGDAPLIVLVPQAQLEQFAGMDKASVEADHWNHWIAGAKSTTLDLVPGLGAAGQQPRDWARWRWPVRLALLALAVNLAALNIAWMKDKREVDGVRQAIVQTFKAAYPKDVPLDPPLQMRKNLALARASSGQVGADEFTSLAASLGESLRMLNRRPDITGIEYRDHVLGVKLKADSVDPSMLKQLKPLLAERKLELVEPAPGLWQIRSIGGKS